MAAIIYVYEIKDGIHLAMELTSIQVKQDDDPWANYISYYAYNGSEVAEIERQKKEQKQSERFFAARGCGGSDSFDIARTLDPNGTAYNYFLILQKSGFGFSSKDRDISKLKLLQTIRIPTQEDKCESFLNETVIAKQWREARPKNEEEAKLQEKSFQFKINNLHCGTIIQNIIDNKPLNTRREEPIDKEKKCVTQPIILKSLNNTMKEAIKLSKEYFKKNRTVYKDLFFKEDLISFYNYYRSRKFFWEFDSTEYKSLYALTKKEKRLIPANEVPVLLINKLKGYLFNLYQYTDEALRANYQNSLEPLDEAKTLQNKYLKL